MVALIIIVVLVLWICVSCIKIVPQAQAYVIERLGCLSVHLECRIQSEDPVHR